MSDEFVPAKGWQNVKNTTERKCKCGNWANHWLKFSGKPWPIKCSVCNCENPAEVGAHVRNDKVNGQWIVPMCKAHNASKETFDLKGNISIVPANKCETCE